MEQSNNTGKIVGALLLGAAVGAAIGILFAPNKGSVTRKHLLSKGEDLTDAMEKKFQEFLQETRKEFDAAKEKVSDFAMNGK